MELIEAGGVGHLEFGSLRGLGGLRHGVSLRGEANGLEGRDFYRADEAAQSRANVSRFCGELGLAGDRVFRCRQVHGCRVMVADEGAGELGARVSRMWAGIGPGVCGRCYEVGSEVAGAAGALFGQTQEVLVEAEGAAGQAGRWYFDLAEANRRLLLEAGVGSDHIELSGCCTYEEGEFFPSYRREGESAGRWALLAGMELGR